MNNIISGFKKTEIWSATRRGPDPSVLTELHFASRRFTSSISSVENCKASDDKPQLEHFRDLFESFKESGRKLLSDGSVGEEGYVKLTTKSGAMLTNSEIIKLLEERKKRKIRKESEKRAGGIRKEEQVRRQLLEKELVKIFGKEERMLLALKKDREPHRVKLKGTRKLRRAICLQRVSQQTSLAAKILVEMSIAQTSN